MADHQTTPTDFACKQCGAAIDAGEPDGGMDERLCLRCWREDGSAVQRTAALPVSEAALLHAQGRRIGAYKPGSPTQHERDWLQPQHWSGARQGTVIAFNDVGDGWLVRLDDGVGWSGSDYYELRLEGSANVE